MDLNKKIGPLPAKAWAGIVVVGVVGGLYLRSHSSGAASTPATPTDPNVDPATGQTWAQEAAQQQAATAPAGLGGGAGDLLPALPTVDPSLSTLPTLDTLPTDPGITTDTSGTTDTGTVPGDTIINISGPTPVVARHAKPRLTTKGAVRAPSGPSKPRAPHGFTTKGLGGGNWEWVPTKPKLKRPSNPPKRGTHHHHGATVSHRKPVTGHRPAHHTTPAHHRPAAHHNPPHRGGRHR